MTKGFCKPHPCNEEVLSLSCDDDTVLGWALGLPTSAKMLVVVVDQVRPVLAKVVCKINWVAVKELKSSYSIAGTTLCIMYTHYGNLI